MMLKYGLVYDEREPLFGFVAEDQDKDTKAPTGKLIGFSYAHDCAIIDPFACEEPVPALKLFFATVGGLSVLNKNTIVVQTAVSNIKLAKEMESLGFVEVDTRHKVFKKII
jgi:hypothetical protein